MSDEWLDYRIRMFRRRGGFTKLQSSIALELHESELPTRISNALAGWVLSPRDGYKDREFPEDITNTMEFLILVCSGIIGIRNFGPKHIAVVRRYILEKYKEVPTSEE